MQIILDINYAFNSTQNSCKKPTTFRDLKTANYSAINDNWAAEFSKHSVNDAVTFFNKTLLKCIDQFVPLKVFIEPKFSFWVSPELKNLIINKQTSQFGF